MINLDRTLDICGGTTQNHVVLSASACVMAISYCPKRKKEKLN